MMRIYITLIPKEILQHIIIFRDIADTGGDEVGNSRKSEADNSYVLRSKREGPRPLCC